MAGRERARGACCREGRRRRAGDRRPAAPRQVPGPRLAAKLSRRQSGPAPQPARRSSLSRPRRRAARGEQARAPESGAEPRRRLRPRPCGCPAVPLGDGAGSEPRDRAWRHGGGGNGEGRKAPGGVAGAGTLSWIRLQSAPLRIRPALLCTGTLLEEKK